MPRLVWIAGGAVCLTLLIWVANGLLGTDAPLVDPASRGTQPERPAPALTSSRASGGAAPIEVSPFSADGRFTVRFVSADSASIHETFEAQLVRSTERLDLERAAHESGWSTASPPRTESGGDWRLVGGGPHHAIAADFIIAQDRVTAGSEVACPLHARDGFCEIWLSDAGGNPIVNGGVSLGRDSSPEVFTDAQGRALLAFPVTASEDLTFEIAVTTEDGWRRTHRLAGGTRRSALEAPRTARIEGLALAGQDGPAAHHQVLFSARESAFHFETVTDANGHFQLDLPTDLVHGSVRVHGPAGAGSARVGPIETWPERLTLQVRPVSSVVPVLVVEDARGSRAAGATVVLHRRGFVVHAPAVRTDSKGEIRIDNVAAHGMPRGVFASHETLGVAWIPRWNPEEQATRILRLEAGVRVTGTFLDSGGVPRAGVRIRDLAVAGREVQTGPQGRFDLGHYPLAALPLTVVFEGAGLRRGRTTIAIDGTEASDPVVIRAPRTWSGRVVDRTTGRPIASYQLELRDVRDDRVLHRTHVRGSEFTVGLDADTAPGQVTLVLRGARLASTRIEGIRPTPEGVQTLPVYEVEAARSLTVRARVPEGVSVERLRVQVGDRAMRRVSGTTFVVQGLPLGQKIAARIHVDGVPVATFEVPAGTEPVTVDPLEVPAPGRLSARTTSAPPPGARITLRHEQWPFEVSRAWTGSIADVPVPPGSILVTLSGVPRPRTLRVQVPAGGSVLVGPDVLDVAPLTCRGVVVVGDDQVPLAGAALVLTGPDHPDVVLARGTTSSDGTFDLGIVAPGSHRLRITWREQERDWVAEQRLIVDGSGRGFRVLVHRR